MLISSLKIKNYRGLDINIDTIEKVSIIIGSSAIYLINIVEEPSVLINQNYIILFIIFILFTLPSAKPLL